MKIKLDKSEIRNLIIENVTIDEEKEYSEEESNKILDEVHDIEVKYSFSDDEKSIEYKKAEYFARIADKIQNQIGERWGF